ncbi:MAG: lysophospholipid acyltransferase family protein [Legionellaceae bacterium]|nr:lysophospholipid acyltransferase family protein [Legionellaceae bacterium]
MTDLNNASPKKPAGILRTIWLALGTCMLTVDMCIRCIARSLIGKVTRPWVDDRMDNWSKKMIALWRIDCTIHNPNKVHPVAGQPTILMCNHSSLFDIPVCYRAFSGISLRMLAKKEMMKIPIMGKAMQQSEFPFIDRKNRRQAIKDLAVIHDMLENGIVMWIAPEGTRSPDKHVGPFKKGGFITAIQTKATIIPIGVRGAFDVLPSRTLKCHLHQKAEVHIGDPIDASKFTLENKEALLHQTREVIKKLAGDTTVD